MKRIFLFLLFFAACGLYAQSSGWFWQNPLPQGNVIQSIFLADQNNAFAVTQSVGLFLKSTNGGLNWSMKSIGNESGFGDICFLNSSTGFLCATGGRILRSTNGGVEWETFYVSDSATLLKIFFKDINHGIVVGSIPHLTPSNTAGYVAVTTNGGTTWTSNKLPLVYSFTCIGIEDNNNCVIGGRGYDGIGLYRSMDFGINWNYISIPRQAYVSSVSFFGTANGYLVGYDNTRGFVYKTPIPELIGMISWQIQICVRQLNQQGLLMKIQATLSEMRERYTKRLTAV